MRCKEVGESFPEGLFRFIGGAKWIVAEMGLPL
jgi:hypothetical protein